MYVFLQFTYLSRFDIDLVNEVQLPYSSHLSPFVHLGHTDTLSYRTIVAGRGPGVTSQSLTSDALTKVPTSEPWDGQDGAVRGNCSLFLCKLS